MATSEFRTTRRVEFADTDMGGIVHFARYFVFMETAEHEFLRSLGSEAHHTDGDGEIGWPRVAVNCEYKAPARFGDLLDVWVKVARIGSKSMTWEIDLARRDALLARGRLTTICCRIHPGGRLESIAIPPDLRAQLAESPAVERTNA